MAFQRIIPGLILTLKRFPVAALASLLAFGYAETIAGGSWSSNDWINVWSLFAGFIAAGAGHLWAETHGLSRIGNNLVAVICALAASAILFFHIALHTSPWFLFAALTFTLMMSPYLRRNAEQGSAWLFNLRLGLAVVLSAIVVLVVALGLLAILHGLDFLLGITMPSALTEHVVVFASTLVGPLFGLSLIPTDLEETVNLEDHRGTLLERGVSVLVNWIMVPLAVVYALILHAYAAKIIALWSLPKGEIGWIVTLFAIGGTATWLIAWPWRDIGTWLLRRFMRCWFWALPVPVVLLTIAIWRRISDYGVTPDRYGIALVTVWAAIVFLYLALRRNRADIRLFMGSAAILWLIASFGPFGAFSTTAASQLPRLQALLEKAGLLKDGVVTGKRAEPGNAELSPAFSMINSIVEAGGADRLAAWLPAEKRPLPTLERYALQYELEAAVGLYTAAPAAQFTDHYNYYGGGILVSSVHGDGRLVGPISLSAYGPRNTAGDVTLTLGNGEMTIETMKLNKRFSLREVMQTIKDAEAKNAGQSLPLKIQLDDKITLYLTAASFDYSQADIQSTNLAFWMLLQE